MVSASLILIQGAVEKNSDLPIWIALIAGVLALVGTLATAYLTFKSKRIETSAELAAAADRQELEIRRELRDENSTLKVANKELERANRLLEVQNEELHRANAILQKQLDESKIERTRLENEVTGLKGDVLNLARKVGQLENGMISGGK